MTRTLFPLVTLSATLVSGALLLGPDAARASQPSPGQDGWLACQSDAIDNGGIGVVFKDPFSLRCCFQENWGGGEGPTVCYTCDHDWKNCSKDIADVDLPMLQRLRNFDTTTGGAVLAPSVDGRTNAGGTLTINR